VCSDEKGGDEMGIMCMVDIEPMKNLGSID
jgi:hypothetical protein